MEITCPVSIATDRYTDSLDATDSIAYAARLHRQIASNQLCISECLSAAYGADEVEARLVEFAGDICAAKRGQVANIRSAFVSKVVEALVEQFEETGNAIT